MKNLKQKKILSVFHDAGSANIGALFIKNKKIKTRFYCKGPAKKIFQKYFKNFKNEKNFKNLFKETDVVLTGTSSKNLIEHRAREICIKKKIQSISFIDHWVGYENGFKRNKKIVLPNILLVNNLKAFQIAKKIFKKTKILKIKNYYEIDILKKVKKKIKKSHNFLYFLEPINNHLEFKALDKFLKYLKEHKKIKNIIFKLHPSEKKNKYLVWLKRNNFTKDQLKINEKIEVLLSWSDYVFGLESYALVLALKSKKRVFTMLPLDNKKSRLPFEEIKSIK